MSIQIKHGKCLQEPIKYIDFNYELDDFQKHSCNSINDGHHILVTAHTGSGKTTVAEYACAYAIHNNKYAIYTAPIKALSLQTFSGLKNKHPEWDIGLQTGDVTINPEAQIMIMTTEILRDMLYFGTNDKRISETAIVIFDEVHYIKDRDRGTVWEESIMLMPNQIIMVMLSATIPESDVFAKWVSKCNNKQVDVVNTNHRVVPLTHAVLDIDHGSIKSIMTSNTGLDTKMLGSITKYCFNQSMLNDYLKQMKTSNLLPALFFRFNRVQCEKLSKLVKIPLVTSDEAKEINHIFTKSLSKFKGKLDNMKQLNVIKSLLLKGVCYHHSGLIHELKEIIQEIFAAGLIKALFVTETFAAGVNVPAKSVVFLDLEKFDSYSSDHRYLLPEEYHQMAGRAGRRGLDTQGYVFLAPLRGIPYINVLTNILTGKIKPFESQFQVNPALILKLTRAGKTYLDCISTSMLAQRNNEKTLLLEKELDKTKDIKIFDINLVDECIIKLVNERNSIDNGKQANKKLKKLNKKISNLSPELKKLYKTTLMQEKVNAKKHDQLEILEKDVYLTKNRFSNQTETIINYLVDIGYLSKLISSDSLALTIKGNMSSEINDCNRILLTEIIQKSYLSGLEFCDIIAVLSMFIEERETHRQQYIPEHISNLYKNIMKLARDLAVVEDKYGLNYLGTNWEINKEFIDLGYMWAKGGTIKDIYNMTDMYEGNFVRNILKLRSMCKTIVKICDICQNHELAKKLEDYETKLVRDIVIPDSLCLH